MQIGPLKQDPWQFRKFIQLNSSAMLYILYPMDGAKAAYWVVRPSCAARNRATRTSPLSTFIIYSGRAQ